MTSPLGLVTTCRAPLWSIRLECRAEAAGPLSPRAAAIKGMADPAFVLARLMPCPGRPPSAPPWPPPCRLMRRCPVDGAELVPGDDLANIIYVSLALDEGSGESLRASPVLGPRAGTLNPVVGCCRWPNAVSGHQSKGKGRWVATCSRFPACSRTSRASQKAGRESWHVVDAPLSCVLALRTLPAGRLHHTGAGVPQLAAQHDRVGNAAAGRLAGEQGDAALLGLTCRSLRWRARHCQPARLCAAPGAAFFRAQGRIPALTACTLAGACRRALGAAQGQQVQGGRPAEGSRRRAHPRL